MSMSFADALALVDREMALGRFAESLNLLTQMRRQVPNNTEIMRRLGFCVAKTGDVPAGLDILRGLRASGDAGGAVLADMMETVVLVPEKARSAQIDLECLRQTFYMDYPKTITIETFTKCNADCVFCPYSSLDRKDNQMSDELFDKIITDLTAIPKHVKFMIAPFKVNEPFLDKRIFSMCHTINARLPHARLEIFSNGSTLTTSNLKKLAEIQAMEFLWISLNHHERHGYEATMRLRYDQTMARLADLHRALEEGWLRLPVKVSRVCDGSPDDAAFAAFIAQTFPRFESMLVGRESWAGQVDVGETRAPRIEGCTRWYEINIMSTGKVALCCMDGKGEHVVGDVAVQSVLDVYNSPGYRALRETARIRKNAGAPCAGCPL